MGVFAMKTLLHTAFGIHSNRENALILACVYSAGVHPGKASAEGALYTSLGQRPRYPAQYEIKG